MENGFRIELLLHFFQIFLTVPETPIPSSPILTLLWKSPSPEASASSAFPVTLLVPSLAVELFPGTTPPPLTLASPVLPLPSPVAVPEKASDLPVGTRKKQLTFTLSLPEEVVALLEMHGPVWQV